MSPPILRCEVTYQGYPCVAGQYRRSDGLSPEGGTVLVEMSLLKKIQVNVPRIKWRAVNGAEMDGMVDIRTWSRKGPGSTVTADRPPAPEPKGNGVNLFGDLVFRTLRYPNDEVVDEMRYSDVYVDAGVDEVTRDQAEILEHKGGLVELRLTDIRRYYPGVGGFYGRINCRRRDGEWDRETIQESGQPWEFVQVLDFFFSQLPGSPSVDRDSDAWAIGQQAPQGIEGRGEPIVQHLQNLLDRTGHKPQMLPSGNYAVNRKFSTRLPKRAVATAVRKVADVDEDVHYERLTSTPTDRPDAVCVIGGRRVMRGTFHCVPVLQDQNGKWYQLEEIAKRWSYPLEKINKQVYVTGRWRFGKVPPDPDGDDQSYRTHLFRQKQLQNAYKHYLPAFLFTKHRILGVDLDSPDFEANPFLPMVDAAWYDSELKSNFEDRPAFHKGEKGDREQYFLMPPVVRGHSLKDQRYTDFDELGKRFDGHLARLQNELEFYEELQKEYLLKARSAGEVLLRSERVASSTLDSGKLGGFGVQDPGVISVGGDAELAAAAVGVALTKGDRFKATTESATAVSMLATYAEMANGDIVDSIASYRAQIAALRETFEKTKEVFKETRFFSARMNGPQEPVNVSIDRRTGLIRSTVPLAQVDKPFFFDGDSLEVKADGGVVVTFGYEVKGSNLAAFTNYLFFADDGGDPDQVAKTAFGGCHRSTPLKARTIPMASREYLLDNGTPVNYNACWSEARGKAGALLELPRRAPGWIIELAGLRKAVLDGGAVSVQHHWKGESGVGMTYVAVNHYGPRLPLGPGVNRQIRHNAAADQREVLQRDGEGS